MRIDTNVLSINARQS
ncbi:Protein of unknown function [Bacillus wiedmannii]|nr:Protein of unknown function [Bacillus wiedmannii]